MNRTANVGPNVLQEAIARRFHRPPIAGLVACTGLSEPLIFSHIVSEVPMPAPTLRPPSMDAFAIHVHHAPFHAADVWIDRQYSKLRQVPDGAVFIFDLRSEPVAQIHEPFEFSRLEISRYEHGMRRLSDLRTEKVAADPVIKHLSLALMKCLALFGAEPSNLFRDAIGQAFFAHVAFKYGGGTVMQPRVGVLALAPWQIKRVTEWLDSNMHLPVAVADFAGLVNLSPSYFPRAFQKTFGMPPHQWVMHKRIERAKTMLRSSSLSLSEISVACGFNDQSHFTKVFVRLVRQTPGRWRRAIGESAYAP